MLSFGIYGKKIIFFGAVFIIFGIIGYLVSHQFSWASIQDASYKVEDNRYVIDIQITDDAKVLINNKSMPRMLFMGDENDEFRYVAIAEEGVYVDNLTINVHLPKPVNTANIKQNVYAVHGIESYSYEQTDPQTLTYSAMNLSPVSTFTIVAQLPKNTVSFSLPTKTIFALSKMPLQIWAAISLIMPILTLILLALLFKQKISDWRLPKSKEETDQLPSNLLPGELEILIYGKISSRAIASTLLSLASRDYITIVQKDVEFSFGNKRLINPQTKQLDTNLSDPEKILSSKIFVADRIKNTSEDILMRIGEHVYSRKIAQVYIAFYDSITKRGLFTNNPSKFHRKYYLIGLILFFLALGAFVFGIWLAPEPKFLLIFWFMMMVCALIVVRMAPQLPLRTEKGKAELSKWLKFKNFLTNPNPISASSQNTDLFEKYLPYAIILNCEVEWAKRFLNQSFKIPDWYLSQKPVVAIEDFIANLFPVIGFVSKSLVASKEPIVH